MYSDNVKYLSNTSTLKFSIVLLPVVSDAVTVIVYIASLVASNPPVLISTLFDVIDISLKP